MIQISADPGGQGQDQGEVDQDPVSDPQFRARPIQHVTDRQRDHHQTAQRMRIDQDDQPEREGRLLPPRGRAAERKEAAPAEAGDQAQEGVHPHLLGVLDLERAHRHEPGTPQAHSPVVGGGADPAGRGHGRHTERGTQGPRRQLRRAEQPAPNMENDRIQRCADGIDPGQQIEECPEAGCERQPHHDDLVEPEAVPVQPGEPQERRDDQDQSQADHLAAGP